MAQAFWKDTLIAESAETVVVEGNHYFPADSIKNEHFTASAHETVCGWKGTASYYNVVVGDDVNENAAWYYADPKPEAEEIRGRVAFWKGVEVKD